MFDGPVLYRSEARVKTLLYHLILSRRNAKSTNTFFTTPYRTNVYGNNRIAVETAVPLAGKLGMLLGIVCILVVLFAFGLNQYRINSRVVGIGLTRY